MIGEHLKKIRISKNISMNRIAELTGITDSRLSRIERGLVKHPGLDDIATILKALDVPLIAFLYETGYCNKKETILKNTDLLNDFEIAHVQSEIDFILKEKGM